MTCPVCIGECHHVTQAHLICYNCGRVYVQSVNMNEYISRIPGKRHLEVSVEIGVAKNVNWLNVPVTFDFMDEDELRQYRAQWAAANTDPDDTDDVIY